MKGVLEPDEAWPHAPTNHPDIIKCPRGIESLPLAYDDVRQESPEGVESSEDANRPEGHRCITWVVQHQDDS